MPYKAADHSSYNSVSSLGVSDYAHTSFCTKLEYSTGGKRGEKTFCDWRGALRWEKVTSPLWVLSFSAPSTELGALIDKLQKNADKVQKNIFDIEQNLNKVKSTVTWVNIQEEQEDFHSERFFNDIDNIFSIKQY